MPEIIVNISLFSMKITQIVVIFTTRTMTPPCLRLLFFALLASCQTTKPFMPSAQPVTVRSVTVETRDFYGRTDVFADIRGTLSSNAAQLADVEQFRSKGNLLILKVMEQTARGEEGSNKMPRPPFQTRVPLETLGLEPGRPYIVSANGVETTFTMPVIGEEEPLEMPEPESGEPIIAQPVRSLPGDRSL